MLMNAYVYTSKTHVQQSPRYVGERSHHLAVVPLHRPWLAATWPAKQEVACCAGLILSLAWGMEASVMK